MHACSGPFKKWIAETLEEESIPPLRQDPTVTSAFKCESTESRTSCRIFEIYSSAFVWLNFSQSGL